MRRVPASLLLIGYFILVPFCFFGGAFSTPAHHQLPGMEEHNTPPCGMAVHCGDEAPVSHSEMYFSLTSTIPVALVIFSIAIYSIVLFFGYVSRFADLPLRSPIRARLRKDREIRFFASHDFNRWLSLLEASPTLA